MRKLYEIDKDIEDLIAESIDPETGELVIDERLDILQLERETKLESVILYYKDVVAELEAVLKEIKTLEDRADSLANTRDGLRGYLTKALDGKKFSTPRCEANFRKSESVETDDEFCEWAVGAGRYEFVIHKEYDHADKTKIRTFLKNGGELEHCKLVEKNNITIK